MPWKTGGEKVKMTTLIKAIGLGAIATAARARLAEAQQPDRNSFSRPPFNEGGTRNIPTAWTIRSRLGWPAGADLGTLPSAIMSRSGPTKSWLAQALGPLAEQPQREREEAYFAYGRPQEPELVALDPGPSPLSRFERPRFGTGGIFRSGSGASVSYLTQQRIGSGRILDTIRERFGR